MIKLLTKWALEHAGWQCMPWALADSHIWVLNPVGVFAVLLLLKCDTSQQFFVLQRPKMKPYNICRLFCGQCLAVTSETNWMGRQLHHHQALVRSPSLDIETHLPNWWVPLVLIQKMSHYLKKKVFVGWGNGGICFTSTEVQGLFMNAERAVVCSAACWPCLA